MSGLLELSSPSPHSRNTCKDSNNKCPWYQQAVPAVALCAVAEDQQAPRGQAANGGLVPAESATHSLALDNT